MSSIPSLPPPDVLRHVVDVHCHPTDSDITKEAMDNLLITACAMSSQPADQLLVRDLANAHPDKVVPGFGYHPWFSHWISVTPSATKELHYRRLFSPSDRDQETFKRLLCHLPDPIPLADILAELRRHLSAFSQAMVGEVGLDRTARIPIEHAGTSRELTPFTVPLEHQLAVLEPQIDLAVELNRNVSIHSVNSHQATLDLLNRMDQKHGSEWRRINVDIHSCGLSVETWGMIEKCHLNVYMSLSMTINGRSSNYRALLAACSPSRILAESDCHTIQQCTELTWEMMLIIAEIKGWTVETTWVDGPTADDWGVVRRLERNWQEFQRGNHISSVPK